MQNRIGIIIPSYNQGKYLEAAIQSVIANKKNADIAIAVVDGGSEDSSLEIIKKYEDELTVWFSEPDKGQADAINKGIRALGDCEYYMWLNSDDVYENGTAVQKIAEYARCNQYEVCYGLSHFVDEQGRVLGSYPTEPFSKENLGKRCYLSQPSVLFSRRAYEEVGPINEQLKMCLDYEYWMRLAQKFEFGYIEEYIGSTRMYGDTKTSTMQSTHLKEAISILQKYYNNVPMHWIVTAFLERHPRNVMKYVPKRLLMVLLRPWKKVIIKDIEG